MFVRNTTPTTIRRRYSQTRWPPLPLKEDKMISRAARSFPWSWTGHSPALGTLDDFRRLVAACAEHSMEVALDFAVQCSPDHPWLKQHPEWFKRRPDGSIRYAENPPKKYEDIVNPDFYCSTSDQLWIAL